MRKNKNIIMLKINKKEKNAIVTKRDIEILNFINLFGFCTMLHLQKRFNLRKIRSYQITRKLISKDLLKHERIFFRQHGIYRLTSKGANFSDLPPLRHIALANYEHDLFLIEVYLSFLKTFPEAIWVTERQLKKVKFAKDIGLHGHLSDGLLIMPDGTQNAIEVELTYKGKNRLERILKSYSAKFDINEVWYYCPKNIIHSVKKTSEGFPFVKVYSLEETLK